MLFLLTRDGFDFQRNCPGKTIANLVLAGFSHLLTETLQIDQRAGWVTIDFDLLGLNFLQLG